LSEPFLSRIESGRRQPSLAALITLARAYSIPLAALLDETPSSSAPVVIRAGSTSERWANGLQYRVASGNSPNVNLRAIHVTVPPKRQHEAFYRHEGEEWLHVLSGRLRLIFEDTEHVLKPGDSAHFEAASRIVLQPSVRKAQRWSWCPAPFQNRLSYSPHTRLPF